MLSNSLTNFLFIGIFFNALSFVFQGFYTGIEKTKVHLSVTITSNIINAYLNAGFIYGKDKIGFLLGNQTNSFFDFMAIIQVIYFCTHKMFALLSHWKLFSTINKSDKECSPYLEVDKNCYWNF